jgi:hypothetical protein
MLRDRPAALLWRRRVRMFGWWYVCIGLGFALLGVRSLVRGDRPWTTALRFVIALGFFALGTGTLRSAVPNWRRK